MIDLFNTSCESVRNVFISEYFTSEIIYWTVLLKQDLLLLFFCLYNVIIDSMDNFMYLFVGYALVVYDLAID